MGSPDKRRAWETRGRNGKNRERPGAPATAAAPRVADGGTQADVAETGALAASLRRGRRGEGSKAERHESFRIGLKRLSQDHYMSLIPKLPLLQADWVKEGSSRPPVPVSFHPIGQRDIYSRTRFYSMTFTHFPRISASEGWSRSPLFRRPAKGDPTLLPPRGNRGGGGRWWTAVPHLWQRRW